MRKRSPLGIVRVVLVQALHRLLVAFGTGLVVDLVVILIGDLDRSEVFGLAGRLRLRGFALLDCEREGRHKRIGQLAEDGRGALLRRVQQRELQLAVGLVRTDGLQSRPLYPNRVLAVMHRRHRLAGRNTLTVTELMRNPLLLLGHDFQTRVLFDEACQAAQFEPSVRLESRSPQSLVALAGAGHGIAIVPSAVRIDVSRVAVAGMLNGPRPLGSWSHVVWDSRRYLPTYAQGLIVVLEDYAKTSYPGHRLGDLTRAVPRPAVQ